MHLIMKYVLGKVVPRAAHKPGFLKQGKEKKSESEIAQSYPTLFDPVDCSPPGSSVHGISQARIWSGLPFPSPGDLSDPGIEPISLVVPELVGRSLPREPPGKPHIVLHA